MLERIHFLVVYVGSAAVVAFVAACLSSPRVATYTCHDSDANGIEQCELAATLEASVPEAGVMTLEARTADEPGRGQKTTGVH